MSGPTVVRKVAFTLEDKGRMRLGHKWETVIVNGERIPRKTQLLALALEFESMLARGEVGSYAEIARLCGVSRARVSQIMGLLGSSPTVQARILLDFNEPILWSD